MSESGQSDAKVKDDVTIGAMWMYGLGKIPLGVIGVPLAVTIPQFYGGDLGVNAALVGAMILLARVTDVFTDPLIGLLSDRTRTPIGRRKPYIFAGIPIFMVALWFLFVPGDNGTAGWLAFWVIVLYFGWTLIELPYGSWGAELSLQYQTRTKIMGLREGLGQVAQLIAVAVPLIAVAVFAAEGNRQVLMIVAITMLILTPLLFAPGLLFVKERPPLDVPHQPIPFKEKISIILNNGPAIRILIVLTVVLLALGITATLALPWFQNVLGLSEGQSYALLAVQYFFTIISIPFWIGIANKYTKHKVTMWAFIGLAAIAPLVFTLPYVPFDVFWAIFGAVVYIGFLSGATSVLPSAMMPDAVDLDTWRSGEQRTGLYYAALGMALKLAIGLGVFVAGVMVVAFDFDMAQGATNTDQAKMLMTIGFAIVPPALNMTVVGILWNYPLGPERHDTLRRALLRRQKYAGAVDGPVAQPAE